MDDWNTVYEEYIYNTDTADAVSDGTLTSMQMVTGSTITREYEDLQRLTKRTTAFYTTNLVFNEDDTEEMNFQLAYNKFVLGQDYHVPDLKNDEYTIGKLQDLAKDIFVRKNTTVVVLGNTKNVSKKSIAQRFE